MLSGRGAVSLHGCTVSSQMYYGVIAKPPDDPDASAAAAAASKLPQITLSVRGCTFEQSLWHISVCTELTPADAAALREHNTFKSRVGVEDLHASPRRVAQLPDGFVALQPWRRGALALALRAARRGATPAGGPAAKRSRREG